MSVLDTLLDSERLDEAFASGGGFSAGQHPRGGHGYFVASGSSGQGVKQVQQKVGAKADGKFGTQTTAKVRSYQKSHGLTVDGVVGKQTAASLLGHKNASSTATGSITSNQMTKLGLKVPGGGSTAKIVKPPKPKQPKAAKPPTRIGGGILVG